jgi:NAD-dependent deacetylase
MRTTIDALLRQVAARLASAARLTVMTGAGVSAASGVPTFRGAGGLWRTFRAEDLATPQAFARDPRLVWEWYDWRRGIVGACRPNAAHEVLARWSHRPGVTLITQNVDGLHERAGSHDVIRFHGSIWDVRCARACSGSPRAWRDETVPLPTLPPPCPYCGGIVRPGVVWFGEAIDPEVLDRCLSATTCDVFLAVGTSAVVYPAASLVHEAKQAGAFTVEINPDPTPASDSLDVALRGPAETILPALDALHDR